MADNSTKITELTEIVESGAKSVNVDGLSVQVDSGQAKKALRDARLTDDATIATGMVRPTVFRTSMRGAW